MTSPAATVSNPGQDTFFLTLIQGQDLFDGYENAYETGDVGGYFNDFYEASDYTSVQEIVDEYVDADDCGNTDPNATPVDVSGLPGFEFQNVGNTQEGFTPSHYGPCEVWLDDQVVFHDYDCAAHYTTSPAEVPMSYDSCEGECMMRFYWLALHEATAGGIQVYKNCVPITNGGSGGGTDAETDEPEDGETEAPDGDQGDGETDEPDYAPEEGETEAPEGEQGDGETDEPDYTPEDGATEAPEGEQGDGCARRFR